MTPKEKAKELVEKYLNNIEDRTGTFILSKYSAKQCALIALDEVIDAVLNEEGFSIDYFNKVTSYWNEVKKEIEKL